MDERTKQPNEQSNADDEAEKIEQFKQLREVFSRKDAGYVDFFDNMNKYADIAAIPGVPQEENIRYFSQVERANRLIAAALEFYLQIKKKQAEAENDLIEANFNLESIIASAGSGIANAVNMQLDVEKLCSIFDWGLTTWEILGEKLGRPSDIQPGEAVFMVKNLKDILTKVNQFR